MSRPPDNEVGPPAKDQGANKTTGRDVNTSITPTPVNYSEKVCGECGAPFTPTSGRQRYCDFHREPKFRRARNIEAQRAHRSGPVRWRPPTSLTVYLDHRRRDRVKWIAVALRLARRLQRDGHEACARRVVEWAERTANGEIELEGCHWLNSLCDCMEFTHWGQHLSPIGFCALGYPRANDDRGSVERTPSDLHVCETPPPGMSEAGYVGESA
jgi:hypothetical protein